MMPFEEWAAQLAPPADGVVREDVDLLRSDVDGILDAIRRIEDRQKNSDVAFRANAEMLAFVRYLADFTAALTIGVAELAIGLAREFRDDDETEVDHELLGGIDVEIGQKIADVENARTLIRRRIDR